jgi:signal transduction histidine kinase/ActR/RegA family two-component response regulator
MTRISDWLIDPADGAERNVEKLLIIADALMRQVEQASGDRGAAYEQFQRAALLEERVRQRTRDLEQTLRLLSDANARLSEASRDAERARRDLAEAIEAVEEGFALFDAAETLVMCNSRFCRGLGDVRDRLRPGLGFADFVAQVSRSRFLALPPGETPEGWAAARMLRHETRQVFNVGLTGDRWIQVSEQRTSDGGTVILQTDVTDIIRLERIERGKLLDRQAQMIRATLEHVNQGICIFDSAGQMVGWNRRLAQLLELPVTFLRMGLGFDTLAARMLRDGEMAGEGTPRGLEAWARSAGPRPPLSFELRRTSGMVLDAFAQEMPGRGFVMSFTDVTRERIAIHSMLRANVTLEARVTERTEALAEALADAERANSSRVRFVAAASHDLLQPLSAAKLFVAAARDDADPARIRATLEKAGNALVSVEGILGALLDISRLELGESEVEMGAVRLAPLLAQLREEFRPIAAGKGLALDILPCGATVVSDPAYLRRILQNLIGNAVRYTSSGRVLVGARRTAEGVRLEVRDTGPGIAAEDQQAIFREFHRLNASASASEGMGLGLAIVERACSRLGHSLTLRSAPGRGSCFAVSLRRAAPRPGAAPAEAAPPAGAAQAEAGEGDRIALLVENDEELREAMALLLERRGVTVLVVGSGEEALDLVEEMGIVPDLYLIDQQLGKGLSGVETWRALRALHGDRPARIVTANHSAEVREACAAAGIGLMRKPIDAADLDAFVASAARQG